MESVLSNDVLRTGAWRLVREWDWKKKKSHINILESAAYASLLKQSIEERPGKMFSVFLDSSVRVRLRMGGAAVWGFSPFSNELLLFR